MSQHIWKRLVDGLEWAVHTWAIINLRGLGHPPAHPWICPQTTRPRRWVHFCRRRGRLCKEEQTAPSIQVLGLLLPEPMRALDSESYWRGATKTRFLPSGLEGRQRGQGTRRGLFHISRAAGKFCRSSWRREVVKTPRKKTRALAQAADKRWGGWRARHTGRLHWVLAATLSPLSGPRAVMMETFLSVFLEKGLMWEERQFGLCEQWLPNESLGLVKQWGTHSNWPFVLSGEDGWGRGYILDPAPSGRCGHCPSGRRPNGRPQTSMGTLLQPRLCPWALRLELHISLGAHPPSLPLNQKHP